MADKPEAAKEYLVTESKAFYSEDLGSREYSQDLLELVPEEIALDNKIIPISYTDGLLVVVTSDLENFSKQLNILDLLRMDSVQKITALQMRYCSVENIKSGFKKAYGKNVAISQDAVSTTSAPRPTTEQTELVEKILTKGIEDGASDIHITPVNNGSIVQFRIDGRLRPGPVQINRKNRSYVVNIIKAMARMDPANKLVPQDGALTFKKVEFRVNTYPTVYDEKVNLRILNGSSKMLRLADMHFPSREEKLLKEIVQNPYGIILMTGPTGQGKSTTLYACMRERNPKDNVIISAEDPVEQKIEGAAQGAMKTVGDNEGVSFTFAKALRASLRQDPDIIFVGEIRDRETGITAVQASQTGHLLFATLHCRSAVQSVQRIVDMGIDRNSFLSEMNCIISQRLVGKNCPYCKEKIISPLNEKIPERDRALLEDGKYSYASKGCEQCNNTGIMGRVPVIELLVFDNELRDYFSVQRGLVEATTFLQRKGFHSMWKMGMDYVAKGDISLAELLDNLMPDEVIKPEKEEEKNGK